MKGAIPIHKHKELSDNGVYLKVVTQEEVDSQRVDYAHRDDYYIFGVIVKGKLRCDIDFKEHTISEMEIQFIRPGQVHRFIDGVNLEGWMLMVESSIVDDRYKLVFDEASISGISVRVSHTELTELITLLALVRELSDRDVEWPIIRNLVSAFVGMVAGCFKIICHKKMDCNRRQVEIFLQFGSLLGTYLSVSHRPSFYADKLHISPVYLNEVVKKVSGRSVSGYIRNELVLHAKRMLCHTNMTVKEIAAALGFEDNAYFTRLFTKTTGKSPLQFRTKP